MAATVSLYGDILVVRVSEIAAVRLGETPCVFMCYGGQFMCSVDEAKAAIEALKKQGEEE